jgi:hypothetical protein
MFSPYIQGREAAIDANWNDRAKFADVFRNDMDNVINSMNAEARTREQPGRLSVVDAWSEMAKKYGAPYFDKYGRNAVEGLDYLRHQWQRNNAQGALNLRLPGGSAPTPGSSPSVGGSGLPSPESGTPPPAADFPRIPQATLPPEPNIPNFLAKTWEDFWDESDPAQRGLGRDPNFPYTASAEDQYAYTVKSFTEAYGRPPEGTEGMQWYRRLTEGRDYNLHPSMPAPNRRPALAPTIPTPSATYSPPAPAPAVPLPPASAEWAAKYPMPDLAAVPEVVTFPNQAPAPAPVVTFPNQAPAPAPTVPAPMGGPNVTLKLNGQEVSMSALVPTLTQQEIAHVITGNFTDEIKKKILDWYQAHNPSGTEPNKSQDDLDPLAFNSLFD